MELPKAPFLTYNDVAAKADAFLQEHNAADTVPVDIERIIEFELGLDIVPIPSLKTDLDIDGFLASDLTSIQVDEEVMRTRPNRYRFTLAHELGHIVLHKDMLEAVALSDPEEWFQFHESFDDGWFERQAHWFAGSVLVPEIPLLVEYKKTLEKLHKAGADAFELSDYSKSQIAGTIAKVFVVSTPVVEKRLREIGEW